jgi:uncharacterized damage-inducible protein DinB
MRIVDPYLLELDQETATTRRVLERVPNDKLGWQPHPKSMSLGQLALHIAQVPGVIAGFVSGPTFEITRNFTQAAAGSTAEVLTALDTSIAKAKDVLGGMDDQTAMSTWTLTRGGKTLMSVPRIGIVRRIMLNHWYHHRGQLSVYLRELDVPLPSIYGPSADENPFA